MFFWLACDGGFRLRPFHRAERAQREGTIQGDDRFVPLSELKEIRRSTTAATDWHGPGPGLPRPRSDRSGCRRQAEDSRLRHLWSARSRARAARCRQCRRARRNRRPARTNMIAIGEGWDGETPLGDDRSECRAALRPLRTLSGRRGQMGDAAAKNVSFTASTCGCRRRAPPPPRGRAAAEERVQRMVGAREALHLRGVAADERQRTATLVTTGLSSRDGRASAGHASDWRDRTREGDNLPRASPSKPISTFSIPHR